MIRSVTAGMSEIRYIQLDTSDTAMVTAYERALFTAFYPQFQPVDSLTKEVLYKERRIRFRIPYASTDIFVACWEGCVIAGMAVNHNTREMMQLEMLGFSVDKSKPGICEGLALFNNKTFIGQAPVLFTLGDLVNATLIEKRINTVYGTCAERLVKGYQMLGFNVIDERMVQGAKRYLLEGHVAPEGPGFHIAR